MKTKILLSAAAVALLAGVPAAAHHRPGHTGGPGDSGRLTAAANPFVLTFGTSTVVSGRLTGPNNGGQRVTLAEDPFPYGDGFTEVATATTDANGNYAFAGLAAGSYNVRLDSVSWMFSTTAIARVEQVIGGQDTANVDFGEWVTYRSGR